MSVDAPFWQDSEDADGDYECNLGVLRLVIYADDDVDQPSDPTKLVQWDCHWEHDWHRDYAATVEQAKRDAKQFGLELLQQVADQLKRLEP
jgi:hypothetical protein